jgi:hypothetical protein
MSRRRSSVACKRYCYEGVQNDYENYPNLLKLVKQTRPGDGDGTSIYSSMFTIYLLKNDTLYIDAVRLLCILDLHCWDLIRLAENIKSNFKYTSNFKYNLANMKILVDFVQWLYTENILTNEDEVRTILNEYILHSGQLNIPIENDPRILDELFNSQGQCDKESVGSGECTIERTVNVLE